MTQYVKCIMCYYLYLSVMYCRFSFGCLDMLRYSHHAPLCITLILTPYPPCPVTIIIIIIYKDAISSASTPSLPRWDCSRVTAGPIDLNYQKDFGFIKVIFCSFVCLFAVSGYHLILTLNLILLEFLKYVFDMYI